MPSFLQKPLFLMLNDLLSNESYAVVIEVQTDINNKMVNPFQTYQYWGAQGMMPHTLLKDANWVHNCR